MFPGIRSTGGSPGRCALMGRSMNMLTVNFLDLRPPHQLLEQDHAVFQLELTAYCNHSYKP